MNKKLYVGNLNYQTSQKELLEYFSQVGNVVEATIITDKYSGKSKGFGFVEFETEEDAKKAIDSLNQKEFQGRKLIVSEAKPRRE